MTEMGEHEHNDNCIYCSNDLPFTLPEAVVTAAKEGRLTVFAGAGISTENPNVFPSSLYSQLKQEAGFDETEEPTFPEVMSRYEEAFGRRALIGQAVRRLEYVETFPSLTHLATRFHQELSTMGPIHTIITTNWDTAFEERCKARPFVVDEDYAYYDLPGRKVFKIHGSINNVSTLIATEEDYTAREESFANSAMGSTLKHILATQTVLFVGFSLTDPDFQSVYRALLSGLGRSKPPAYFVSPFPSELSSQFGLRAIQTDGTNFLRHLKQRLVEDGVLFEDSVLERCSELEYASLQAQNQILDADWRSHPALIFSISYLDGIRDCTGRAQALQTGGEYTYKAHLAHMAHSYDSLLQTAISRARWWDAAYIRGYLNTIFSFFVSDDAFAEIELSESFSTDEYPGVAPEPDEQNHLNLEGHETNESEDAAEERDADEWQYPALFEELDLQEIMSAFDKSTCSEKDSIRAEAAKLLSRNGPGMIFRHTPFLDGVIDDAPSAPRL